MDLGDVHGVHEAERIETESEFDCKSQMRRLQPSAVARRRHHCRRHHCRRHHHRHFRWCVDHLAFPGERDGTAM